ncbi:hypothetical protein DP113_07435 [Brasilonema octagenarum UFV-E1]|uniref:Lipoprotein n=2 Tax=Brasilonema TaxID=383614 RepID=A0A856MBR0_9CYAN|nr:MULTISPECIES: hypothetical protein [Brasilonema]NMF64218.1 hypothetical protein [Brasilonema octagenarum UFV-OR1]QDL07760.1 hypothetical protein DP114_07480 [Brasilonema sennae CENA114]QDL14122.1 hypothetical protein DP113_07435 [Brasilonema octagenarum UFV-E1]
MKSFYQLLGISATIILASLALTSCKHQCEFTTQDAQKESVQLNDSIYSRIFGSQSCSPHKLVLRLPVNVNIKTEKQDKVLTSINYTPKITTLVTFSSNYKIFDISRIDEYANGFIYTNKDTCLAWKPSNDNKQQEQVLYLSMERNLQIRNPNIKSVIFLVSLPLEMKEAGVNITLERYVRDKDTSKVGAINYFNFSRQYPILKFLLRQKEKGRINASEAFHEGKQVSNEVAREFLEISDMGGVLLEHDLESMIEAKYKKTYLDSPESPACEIPKDLKQL